MCHFFSDVDIRDEHNIGNSLLRGPSDPSTVSFDCHWRGVYEPEIVRDTAEGYGGYFLRSGDLKAVSIEWSGVNHAIGTTFVTDPARTSLNNFALLGLERNGSFFSPDEIPAAPGWT